MNQPLDFETMLAAERPRLVRLCARLSGNLDAAEDLAQEILVTLGLAGALGEIVGLAPMLNLSAALNILAGVVALVVLPSSEIRVKPSEVME